MKVPDCIISHFLTDSLKVMKVAFIQYIMQVNYESLKERGETYTTLSHEKETTMN
jgi:hypothetical protein